MLIVAPFSNLPLGISCQCHVLCMAAGQYADFCALCISWTVAEELGTLEGTPATLTIEKCPRLSWKQLLTSSLPAPLRYLVAHADAPYNRPFFFTCYDLIFDFTPVIIFLRTNLHNGRRCRCEGPAARSQGGEQEAGAAIQGATCSYGRVLHFDRVRYPRVSIDMQEIDQ